MAEVKIENIEGNYDQVLELVGQESFVNWEGFTKSSTQLSKQMEDLAKQLTIFRDVQQRRFITTMKQLKGFDIPDLIKTVKAKKLPKEALKAILPRFTLSGEKLALVEPTETLKAQSQKLFETYAAINEALATKLAEAAALLQERIIESGVLNEVAAQTPKELVSTFKHNFDESQLELAASSIQVEYLPGTVDTLHIKTYAQIVEKTQDLIKQEYKRLTQEARNRQRALFKEPKKYIDSLVEYIINTEILVVEGQKAIVKKLGLTPEKMEETENILMEKGLGQNLLLIQSTLRSRVKESLVPEKEASLEQAKGMVKYQVSEINNIGFFKELFAGFDRTPKNFQLVPMLLALVLNDLVFEKYGLEEEDFTKTILQNGLMANPEIMADFKDMEVATIKLVQELGVISPEAGQFMLQQANLPPGQYPQVPNGPPGAELMPFWPL